MKDPNQALLYFFPLFFVGIWCLVMRVLSFLSGWTRLAERFHTEETFQGQYYRFQSVHLNQVQYNNSINMGVNEKGLYLVPMILMRLFHKPLLIPWGEIHAEPFQQFFFRGYRLTFPSLPGITLALNALTFDKMVEYLKMKSGFQPGVAPLAGAPTPNKEMNVQQQYMYRGIRRRSARTLCGLPLVDIAFGPDPEKGEFRGHAHGIIAIGDMARGWIALGGAARGGIAIGGAALGIVAVGGVGAGIIGFGGLGLGLLALGGLAIGGIAIGGGAIGLVAVGGGAIGYYALGGGAIGKYVYSAMQRSPEAVEFFKHWLPFLPLK